MKLSGDGQEILYCSYLGGSKDDGAINIELDSQGCILVMGRTASNDFPVQNAYDSTYNGGGDCFVTKFTPNGSAILFSTYVGGSSEEYPFDFALDSEGNAIVVGSTSSSNWPVITTNQQQECHTLAGSSDGFVFKLSTVGSELEYSMYLGGGNTDVCDDVVVSNSDYVTLSGTTHSSNFPIKRAFKDQLEGASDGYLMRLNASGHITYSTYFGGTGTDGLDAITIDDSGIIYAAGAVHDGSFPIVGVDNELFNSSVGLYLSIIDLAGKEIRFSGVLRNTEKDEDQSWALNLIVVSEHEVWMLGTTKLDEFPITDDAFDTHFDERECFLTMVDPKSCSLNYSSFFGGSDWDISSHIAISETGELVGVGTTRSSNIPIKNAIEPGPLGNEHQTDGFMFKVVLKDFTTNSHILPFDFPTLIIAGMVLGSVTIFILFVLKRKKHT
jgi:hypothetical protein